MTLPEAFKKTFRTLMGSGAWELELPAELGGHVTPPSVQWAVNELNMGANPAAYLYSAGPKFAYAVYAHGIDRDKRIARIMIERQWAATMVLTEPDAGSDVGAGRARAVPQADGSWHIEGVKRFITAGEHDLAGLGAGPILIAGTEEQKKQWLGPLVEAPILGCFGLTEPGAGSDVSGIQTTAVARGDEYVINGSKMFITNAGHASWMVCFASTDPARAPGPDGLRVPMDTPGVTIEKHLDKMGQRATDTSAVAFQDVVVPAANRLGGEGDGFKIAMQTLDFTRPGTAVGAVGVAQAAFELAVEYTKERVQFGMPIAMNQGVSFLVADMATEIEAARLLTWQAAWMIDEGWGRKATKFSSFAKLFAADTAMKVTTDAVQVFGGYGYMKEYPVEKLMRDAKLFQIYEGTSQIQRLVIAKEIYLQ